MVASRRPLHIPSNGKFLRKPDRPYKGARTVERLKSHLKPLREWFALSRAVNVTTAECRAVYCRTAQSQEGPCNCQQLNRSPEAGVESRSQTGTVNPCSLHPDAAGGQSSAGFLRARRLRGPGHPLARSDRRRGLIGSPATASSSSCSRPFPAGSRGVYYFLPNAIGI